MLEDELQTTTTEEKKIHVKFMFMENGKQTNKSRVISFVKKSEDGDEELFWDLTEKVQEKKEFKLLLRSDHSILNSEALAKVLSSGNVGTTAKPLEVIVGE